MFSTVRCDRQRGISFSDMHHGAVTTHLLIRHSEVRVACHLGNYRTVAGKVLLLILKQEAELDMIS